MTPVEESRGNHQVKYKFLETVWCDTSELILEEPRNSRHRKVKGTAIKNHAHFLVHIP